MDSVLGTRAIIPKALPTQQKGEP